MISIYCNAYCFWLISLVCANHRFSISQFNIPLKVARIRDQHYLDPNFESLFSKNQISVDLIISPETEVAEAIRRRLIAPGDVSYTHLRAHEPIR